MPLIQWVYGSAASLPFSADELEALLGKARGNNEDAGITGILLYHDGSFLQVLEGEEEAVSGLFDKIHEDDRHCDVRLIYRGEIEERNFGAWSMGFCRPSKAEDLPGFIDVFRSVSTPSLGLEGNADRVRKLIDGFKDGRWRQKIAA